MHVVDEFSIRPCRAERSGAKRSGAERVLYVGFKRPGNDTTPVFNFAVTHFFVARAEILAFNLQHERSDKCQLFFSIDT